MNIVKVIDDNLLVYVNKKKEARTAHIVIADGMNVTQDAALKLIKKYKSDLEYFGRLRFEFVPFLTKGGPQKKKVYALNRDQEFFLITLMRNNPKTVKFKKNLVRAFADMEAWIADRLKSSLEHRVMSDTLSEVRKIIGKETRNYHYSTESNLVNWALTGKFAKLDRDYLSANELDLLYGLQKRNSVLLGAGMSYPDRKESLKLFAELQKSRG